MKEQVRCGCDQSLLVVTFLALVALDFFCYYFVFARLSRFMTSLARGI